MLSVGFWIIFGLDICSTLLFLLQNEIKNIPMIVLGVLFFGVVIISVLLQIRKYKELHRLWIDYDVAKLIGDKAKALEAGRAFYKRKNGNLTIYDEQNLANELSTIK
jgi:hypothetical protein